MKTYGALCILLLISMLAGCVTDSTGPTSDPISTGNQTAHEGVDRYCTYYRIDIAGEPGIGLWNVQLFDENDEFFAGSSGPNPKLWEFHMWFRPPTPTKVVFTFTPYSGGSASIETDTLWIDDYDPLSIPPTEWECKLAFSF